MVAISRAISLQDFAIGNAETEITRQALKRIGNTKAYQTRVAFLNKLRSQSTPSQVTTREAIRKLDPNEEEGDKTYEGGCEYLLQWYRHTF